MILKAGMHRIVLSAAFLLMCSVGSAQQLSKERFEAIMSQISTLIDNYRLNPALAKADSLEKILQKDPEKRRLASIYNTKGTIYREKDDPKQAIHYFLRSVEINEAIHNQQGVADNYVNLGAMYSMLGENVSALNYYFRAVSLYNKLDKRSGISVLYNNIGNIYLDMQNYKNALENFNRSFVLSQLSGDSMNLAMVCHNLGNCSQELYGSDSAIAYYDRSLSYLKGFSEGLGHLYNYNRLSDAFYKKNDLNKAEEYALRSININKKGANLLSDLATSYGLLVSINEKKGNIKKAFDYQRMLLNIKDSMQMESTRSELMKAQYEFDLKNQKKEQELVRQNQEAINTAKMESKNKNLTLSYSALGFAVIMGLLILNGYRQKRKANKIISKQKEEVEQKNSEILSSINYAKRIQYALLAHKEFMEQYLPEHFVYFHPKDIVSGDFYWATKHGSKFYLAVCDSTGHGVPGAFMSLLNIGFLTEAINEKNIEDPGKIFDHVRTRLVESISKEGQQDGFDGILISIDDKTKEIKYAAANNAPLLISDGTIMELEKDSMPVGIGEKKDLFTTRVLRPKKGEVLYLYTDGYADQFGGPRGKKFKYKQLNERLLQLSSSVMDAQKDALALGFEEWKGELEQVDDVLIIGIRF
jgi:serine phosphatase RsbU (regulator of sigma subunit)/tetratricopeptide (TPR) repeat protein